MEYAHGETLRERLGDLDKTAELVGNRNNRIVATKAVGIVNSANNSVDAFNQLSQLRNAKIDAAIADLVSERIEVAASRFEDVDFTRKLDNPTGVRTDSTIDFTPLTPEAERVDPRTVNQVNRAGLTPDEVQGIRDSDGGLNIDNVRDYTKSKNILLRVGNAVRSLSRNKIASRFAVGPDGQVDFTRALDDPNRVAVQRTADAKAEFDASVKRARINLDEKDFENIQAYLTGETDVVNKAGLKPILDAARDRVDNNTLELEAELTRSLELGNRNESIAGLLQTLNRNIGQYLNRSYRAFDDFDGWISRASKSDSEGYQKALASLMQSENVSRSQARKTIDDYVEQIKIEKGDLNSLLQKGVLEPDLFKGQTGVGNAVAGSSILRGRTDLPQWMQDILEVNTNGVENYLNTVRRQTQLTQSIRRDNNVVQSLSEQGVVSSLAENVPSHVGISEKSILYNKFSALSGVKMDADVKDALTHIYTNEKASDNPLNTLNSWLKQYLLIFNAGSHATQAIGFLAMASTHSIHMISNARSTFNGIKALRNTPNDKFLADTLARWSA